MRLKHIILSAFLLMSMAATAQKTSHVIVGGSVFGGGKSANVGGKSTVLIDQMGASITNDVYGGGALANVGTTPNDSTTVTILQGVINGNVYGGGLGDSISYGGSANIAALVHGKVYVNIGDDTSAFNKNRPQINGSVFGCNNINGTPLDSVFVNIYKTAHTPNNLYPNPNITSLDALEATFPQNAADSLNYPNKFAIKAVYGGGNKASYRPNLNENGDPKCTTVHVFECTENTIQTIYGGGNAANVGDTTAMGDPIAANTLLIIDGGRYDQVFGGGNGYSASHNHDDPTSLDYNPGANIFGTAVTQVLGGLYRQVFGGSNQYGDIDSVALCIDNQCEVLLIYESFGGANEADITSNISTTLLCNDYSIGSFYGGSNKADINGDVTLNVRGGNYTNVFGGSKGTQPASEDPEDIAQASADILGNVTLNLHGGTMVNAFGGSDVFGSIAGTIIVNVWDTVASCHLQVDTIYGGGQDAAYEPDLVAGKKIVSPLVNLWKGTVGHGTVKGCVFGGGKGAGAMVTAHPKVVIGDTIAGHSDYSITVHNGNVFGGGNAATVDGIDSVLMLKANSVVSNLFGGGNAADADTAVVMMTVAASVDTIFGGGNLAGLDGTAMVTVTKGTIRGGIYGGSNKEGLVKGDIIINITDNEDDNEHHTVIGNNEAAANIHGGGYGAGTRTNGNVIVNFGDAPTTHSDTPKIFGDIYGGSALGWVNDAATDITVVNVVNGTVGGNIYGGGLGQQAEGGNPAIAALVNGKTYVNIGAIDNSDNVSGEAIIGGSVYGCNNQNGSPQDSVFVNIFKTYHTTGETGDEASNTASTATYAIDNVFGGGNKAAYEPTGNQRISVEVYNCDNTIEDVFGGGDAAAVTKTHLVVNGGRFDRIFAGGNGENAPANIGTGGTNLVVRAGKIRQLFGGSNMQGNIVGPMNVDLNWDNSSCIEEIDEFFGGSNEAVIGTADSPVNLNTTVACGVNTITDVYGGSNKAKIYGNVNLTINGGTIINAFGGSKGETDGVDAEIRGDVKLNLFGGTVHHAFGGSNYKGNISGQVTVNVLDTVTTCPLALDTVYGGGNLAPYTPSSATLNSPAVNLIHGAVTKYVYGGGLGSTAVVTANPVVTVGYDAATMSTLVNDIVAPSYTLPADPLATVGYDIYGGGDAANVNGTSTVRVQRCNTTAKYVYGGGNAANVTNTQVFVSGGVIDTIFGGGHGDNAPGHTVVANVTSNGTVTISGGTIGKVFAGCNLNGSISGNMNLNIAKSTDSGACDMYIGEAYGGGNMAAGKAATITIGCTGTIVEGADGHIANPGNIGTTLEGIGTVYGGANQAAIDNDISLEIHSGIVENVFGGNNLSGTISGSIQVEIDSTESCSWYVGNVYGGGNQAAYGTAGSNYPVVNIKRGLVSGDVFGGGLGSTGTVTGNPQVTVNSDKARVNGSVYGGGSLASTVGNPLVTLTEGSLTQVFGGGKAASVTGAPIVNINGGTVSTGVYGGCHNQGEVSNNITVNVTGGTINSDVFGGGYGQETSTSGNVVVNIGEQNPVTHNDFPKIYGDVYGGSALGEVNADNNDTTTVNINNGTLYTTAGSGGNVYGGGLGYYVDTNHDSIPAKVNGVVTVNIGSGVMDSTDPRFTSTTSGEAIIQGNVYGCNNTYGSPQHHVTVNIFKTYIHPDTIYSATYIKNDGIHGEPAYELANVFGGGNRANFLVNDSITVNVYSCDNTIRRTFGGSNAAASKSVFTMIQGGRIHEAFGGGNGEVSPADVNGNVTLEIHGGRVDQSFGGSNQQGTISGTSTVTIDSEGGCGESIIEEFFCGGNFANYYGDIDATIDCADGLHIQNLYGGCKQADVLPSGEKIGNVHLVVNGGTYENIFGGSQGRLAGTDPEHLDAESADISGHILLEINGGKVTNAIFGGSHILGNVAGTITVNIEDKNTGCPLDLSAADVYGGGNQADYVTPTVAGDESAHDYPQVNVKNATVKNVFGGGLEAKVTGNPQIRIKKGSKVLGNVYGGGNMGELIGNPKVIVNGKDATENPHVFPNIELPDPTKKK